MSHDAPLPLGKLPTELLADLLATLPHDDVAVRLGPAVGEDAAAIDVPAGTVVVATDPITLTGNDGGRYAVIVNANDVAVTGAAPRWFLLTLLLPLGTTAADVRATMQAVAATLTEVGASLVGGHSEVTSAVSQPVLVGQMVGLVDDGRLVRTAGAGVGDRVVQVGPAPVEGAAVLAAERADALATLPAATLRAAAGAATEPGISVVQPALAAAELGATAMHDPTEGGLAAGLHELARAAGVGLRIDPAAVQWFEPGLAVCEAVGADPWATLASGCLLATFPLDLADGAVAALERQGWDAVVIGEVVTGSGVADTAGVVLPWPERDEVARLLDEGQPEA